MLSRNASGRFTGQVGAPVTILAGALALAVAVPAADQAGYTPSGQAVFVAIGGCALVTAVLIDEGAAFATLRSGPVLALCALALLTLTSTAWTLVKPVDSFRWGLVVGAYAAIAVAAGVLARRPRGVLMIALAVASLAAIEAALGLTAAALRELPYAERIGGSWRAGGTFEYSAALALLEVMALPALLSAMGRARTAVAAAAAGAGALAVGTMAISESRLELALALIIGAAAVVAPARTMGRARTGAVAALVLLALAGTAVRSAVGGYVAPHEVSGAPARVIELVVIVAASAAAWAIMRERLQRLRWPFAHRPPRAALWLAAVAVAAVAFTLATAPLHGRGVEPSAGFLHGRSAQWQAAWRTYLDRPVVGAGAGSFLAASAVHQGRAPVRYAHDLPLENAAELGLGGILITLLLYLAVGAAAWSRRHDERAWLLIPGVAAFLIANLFDWEWHLPLSGAVWALLLGALVIPMPQRAPPSPARAQPKSRRPRRR